MESSKIIHWKSAGKIKSFEAHEWVIKNFDSFMDIPTGSFLTSPMITTNHHNIKWRLVLFPKGCSENSKDWLSLFIQFFSDIPTESSISDVTVKTTLINGTTGFNAREGLANYSTIRLLPESEYHNNLISTRYGIEHFFERRRILDEDEEVLDEDDYDSLKICCEVFFLDPIYSSSYQDHPTQDRFKEIDDFKKLLVDEKFNDFTLTVGKKSIRVHKAILANRSPVFEAMLTKDMTEKKQNKVKITGVKYPVLKELLHFIYTGTVDNVKNINNDLLIAADKYCVTGLKTLCEKTFFNDLNVENALERLVLADTYNCVFLKSQVTQYIVYNSRGIVDKKEFGSLSSDLMHEIIRAFSVRSFVSSM